MGGEKKGFYVKNYMKRQVMIDRENYDPDTAYKIAKKVFKRSFSRDPVAVSIQDDLIQEAAVRSFELSGKPQTNPKYTKEDDNNNFELDEDRRISECEIPEPEDPETAEALVDELGEMLVHKKENTMDDSRNSSIYGDKLISF